MINFLVRDDRVRFEVAPDEAERRGLRIGARVLDLRWLAPLPVEDVLRAARATGRVLVADETRHSGGVGEGVLSLLVEHGFTGAMARVASRDSSPGTPPGRSIPR